MEVAMPFQANITFDIANANPNAYQKLQNAIADCGWQYTPTSSLYLDHADSVEPVRLALDALARYVPEVGDLRMLSISVQEIGIPRNPPAHQNHPNALADVREFPSPALPDPTAAANPGTVGGAG
jgi:hypothetical protein